MLLLLVSSQSLPAQMAAETTSPAPLAAADYGDPAKLASLLWERSQDVLEARRSVGTAASEVTRARKYPNPQLDFSWGTIPIGQTTPPNLNDPIGNVPNYNVGLSELFELAKRGPRQAAAAAELEASRAQALAVLGDRFFDLLDTIGRMAKSQVRIGAISGQTRAGERILELERARAEKGEIAFADVERSEVEHARLVAARDSAQAEMEQARAECTALLALDCPPFPSAQSARQYLRDTAGQTLPTQWSDEMERQRPDIAALAAAVRAASERMTLAERKVVPDVTLRMGYTYDNFVISGNQRQSLGLGVQLPLPVADQGQADIQAATASLDRARHARDALIAAGQYGLTGAVRQRDLNAQRSTRLGQALEKARALRTTMENAAQRGGASQVDVLLARRAYQELLLDRADLDAATYDATLRIRRAAGMFPRPEAEARARDMATP